MKLLKEPWPEITRALKVASSRTVVSAYLGTGAGTLLPLREDDFLLVNASRAIVKQGLTNPHTILEFWRRGVRCFSSARLHAKVYVADSLIFIGSPNASRHSRDVLTELCLRVFNKGLAARIRAWAEGLQADELGERAILQLCKIYRPPVHFERRKTSKRRDGSTPGQRRLWITSVFKPEDTPDSPQSRLDRAAARSKIKDHKRYYVEDLSASDKWPNGFHANARRGDQVVVIDHLEGRRVFGPMRVLGRGAYKTDRGTVYRIFVEWDDRQRGAAFGLFRKTMRTHGMKIRPSGNVERIVRKASTASALREYLEMHS